MCDSDRVIVITSHISHSHELRSWLGPRFGSAAHVGLDFGPAAATAAGQTIKLTRTTDVKQIYLFIHEDIK